MVYKIDPVKDWPCVDEFRQGPIGHHSPNLQRILNIMRCETSGNKTILLTRIPFKEWILGVIPANRSGPIAIEETAQIFHTCEDAEWAVFCARWEQHTGQVISTPRNVALPEKP